VQGALEIARSFKRIHPDVPVILGGMSSTYYAQQLIQYPFVDMVMRGHTTHDPMHSLLGRIKRGETRSGVSNLFWKTPTGDVVDNGFDHRPSNYGCGIDWSSVPSPNETQLLPILEILSTQTAGCSFQCGWCGGSRDAFKRVFGGSDSLLRKSDDEVAFEFESMRRMPHRERIHFHSIGSYNENPERLDSILDQIASVGLKSVSYEQFYLTPDAVLKRMVDTSPRTGITLSPESSNSRIARLAGRGVYSMAEMEAWIERALAFGIQQIDVWFFVGMPEQDEDAVKAEVEYCAHLLDKFAGQRVVPFLCPMIPFLDPASTFFEQPDEHGYRVFHRTVEEHRRGMLRASIINRINYETRWLSRAELVRVGYQAIGQLMRLRAENRQIPMGLATSVGRSIQDALDFIEVVHQADCLADARDRARALDDLGDGIEKRNQAVLFSGVANQAMPLNRLIGGRWFDEMGWTPEQLDRVSGHRE
jgi:clorobiocin biosynthesis protein CloN6